MKNVTARNPLKLRTITLNRSFSRLLKNPSPGVFGGTDIPVCHLFSTTSGRLTGKNACPTGFFNNLLGSMPPSEAAVECFTALFHLIHISPDPVR